MNMVYQWRTEFWTAFLLCVFSLKMVIISLGSLEEREFLITKVRIPTFYLIFCLKKIFWKGFHVLNVKAKISNRDSSQILWDSASGEVLSFLMFSKKAKQDFPGGSDGRKQKK